MKEIDYRSETLKQDLYDVARRREWDERLTGANGAYIIPTGAEHQRKVWILQSARQNDERWYGHYELSGV